MADGHTFISTASPTRDELKTLAGMPLGRQLDQAEIAVAGALERHRGAQAGQGWLKPAETRAMLRSAVRRLRAVRSEIIAEYGHYLPAIRRGRALRGEAA